jgi:hypothetical protein
MRGFYKVRMDGQEYTVPNLITTVGKEHILRYMSGQTGRFAEAIGVGTMATSPVVGNTALGFEVSRFPVAVASPDFTNDTIIFKTEANPELSMIIHELGLWGPDLGAQQDSSMMFTFESDVEPWSVGTFTATNARIGDQCLQVTVSTSATTSIASQAFDFSQFSNADNFVVAAQSTGAVTIKLRLHSSVSDYFEVTGSKSAGYTTTVIPRTPTTTGNPSWDSITSVDVILTATSDTVYLDGIKLDTSNTTQKPVLISRAVLGAPITKRASSQLDIEYVLEASA